MKPKDKYLLNLLVTAQPGDVVLYLSSTAEKYTFENGCNETKKVKIIKVTDCYYITKINKHGIEIGFHKSRLLKVIQPANGQTQIFN